MTLELSAPDCEAYGAINTGAYHCIGMLLRSVSGMSANTVQCSKREPSDVSELSKYQEVESSHLVTDYEHYLSLKLELLLSYLVQTLARLEYIKYLVQIHLTCKFLFYNFFGQHK